jgi:hypothetical protein
MNSYRFRIALAAASLAAAAPAQDGASPAPASRGAAPAVAPSGSTVQASALQVAGVSPTVLFTSITGHPTADVPGIPGLHFANTPTTHQAPFDRPFGSANGNWIMAADTDAATSADDVILVNGQVAAREGDVAPFATVPGSTLGPFQVRQGINAAGEYVFKNNTSETSTADDYVVKVTAGPTYTVLAREALDIPQLGGTEVWNDNLEGVLIAANGDVGFEANGISGGSTANDEIYVFGNALLYQEGITVPAGQAGGATDPWQLLDFEDTWVSPDGAHVLMKGDVATAGGSTTTDDVIVYDGTVVLQEGFPIPGSSFVDPIEPGGVLEVAMGFDGAWFARGSNATTGEDWIVRNGVVIAARGQPITTGSGELWDDATFGDLFFAHQGDSNGNWVIGGVTSHVDPLTNGVLVLNGTDVIVREGDPIDVDGNGLFDDDAFFNTFGNDDALLFDDGRLLFNASMRDGTGVAFAQGFFEVQTNKAGFSTYCTAGTSTNGCVATIGATGTPSASASSGFTISVASVEGQKQGLLFYGVNGPHNGPWGIGGTSFLCVKSPTQRMGVQVSGGTAGACDGALSEDWLAFMAAHPGALGQPISAGQTVWSQAWYRDPPAVKTTNLSDGLEFTLVP